jgi:hypothetical protein
MFGSILAAGCSEKSESLIHGDEIRQAFSRIGERVVAPPSMQPAKDNPDLDAVYVPASTVASHEVLWSVGVYDNVRAARDTARWMKTVSPSRERIIVNGNASLSVSPRVPKRIRDRLISTFVALGT